MACTTLLGSPRQRGLQTITVAALKFLATDTVHYGQMAVASLIAIVPEIILAIFIQKHLVRGLSFGAVKG